VQTKLTQNGGGLSVVFRNDTPEGPKEKTDTFARNFSARFVCGLTSHRPQLFGPPAPGVSTRPETELHSLRAGLFGGVIAD
jgi:hypothetical protein